MKARLIDFETTGRPEDKTPEFTPEILEMARLDLDLETGEITSPWSTLCGVSGPIPPQTKAVHHILESDVAGLSPAAHGLRVLARGMAAGDYYVAHNASFEQFFFPTELPWICTYRCALVIWPDAPKHDNQTLRYWLDIELGEESHPPHRALPDCYVTAEILMALIAACCEDDQPETFQAAIDKLVTISKYPPRPSVFSFGKHKGDRWDAHLDYCDWIANKSDFDEDTKWVARYWIKKAAEPKPFQPAILKPGAKNTVAA